MADSINIFDCHLSGVRLHICTGWSVPLFSSHATKSNFLAMWPISYAYSKNCVIVGHPEPEKKILLAFLSTFWHPCSKCILMCFKKDRGGCQVWKCPKVPELGQRSTECKILYIRQILAFLSISYPKL